MTKSQAVEAINRFSGTEGIALMNSLHTDVASFFEVEEYLEGGITGEYNYLISGSLVVNKDVGDLSIYGNTGITKQVFQEKFLETDHEVEEFAVDYSTGVVYYTVGDVLEDGTETRIEGNVDFWEVVDKCQN